MTKIDKFKIPCGTCITFPICRNKYISKYKNFVYCGTMVHVCPLFREWTDSFKEGLNSDYYNQVYEIWGL